MSLIRKYLSYLNVYTERTYDSAYNGVLEINWVNGKKVLDTTNTNYSYGNLGKVLKKALQHTSSDFISEYANILLLGMGGGDVIKQLQQQFKSKAHITALEIDPVIIQIAMTEFGILPGNKLEIIQDDARMYLKYLKKSFDLIIVDLFTDTEIPEFVFHNEFLQSIFNALNNQGTAIFNTIILTDEHHIRNDKFVTKLNTIFTVQSFQKLYGHNHLLICQKA